MDIWGILHFQFGGSSKFHTSLWELSRERMREFTKTMSRDTAEAGDRKHGTGSGRCGQPESKLTNQA